jgi:hypothetical protein
LKSDEMKRNVIILMVVGTICFFCVSYTYGKNEEEISDEWIFYGKTDLGNYYYDKSSVTKVSSQIIKVLFKRKYSKVGKDLLIKLMKDNNVSISGWGKLDYETNLLELNCGNKTSKLIRNVQYDDGNEGLNDIEFLDPPIQQTRPGSLDEELLRRVCPK